MKNEHFGQNKKAPKNVPNFLHFLKKIAQMAKFQQFGHSGLATRLLELRIYACITHISLEMLNLHIHFFNTEFRQTKALKILLPVNDLALWISAD